jgi:hypothetical protein
MPKSAARRRAWIALCSTAAAAFLLHAALAYWTSRELPYGDDLHFQKRIDDYRRRLHAARAEGRGAIVVVGSSRVEWGFRARTAQRCLAERLPYAPVVQNFGAVKAGPIQNWAIVRRITSLSALPRAVVVEINPTFCGADAGRPYESARLSQEVLIEAERRQLERIGWTRVSEHLANIDRLSPVWLSCRGPLLERLRPQSQDRLLAPPLFDYDEFGDSLNPVATSPEVEQNRKERTLFSKKEYEPRLQTLAIHPEVVKVFDDLIATCHSRGIALAFLMMPEADEFRAWYGPGTHAAIAGLLDHLRERGAPRVFDAREWVADQVMHYDGSHLLLEGAEVFSERFAAECLMPWIEELSRERPFQTSSLGKTIS